MNLRHESRRFSVEHEEAGSTFVLQGSLGGVVIDVSSGLVTTPDGGGLDDSRIGLLRQHYAEQKFVALAERERVGPRAMRPNGDIVLRCR